jgi:hypothetical protein
MSTPNDLYIESMTSAFTRIRALLFVNLGLCAIVLSNAYLENFSFDDQILKGSYLFREQFDLDKTAFETKRSASTDPAEREGLSRRISELKARIVRLDNSLKDFKFRSVTIPLTGVNVPANDLNVICSIFLLFLSLWLLFSVNQARSALGDEGMRPILEKYLPALRHAVMLVLPRHRKLLRGLAGLLVAAPAITITLATINDLISVLTYDYKAELVRILGTVLVRLVFLTAVSVCLWVICVVCLRAARDASSTLYPGAAP